MINIYLEKHLTNNVLKPIFKLEKIESDDSFKNLIKENYLILNDTFNLELNQENEENRPCVCLQMKNMVDNGDYDYNDNYVPYYEEEISYIEIFYSPLNGEKINFIISKEIDDSKIINDILSQIESLERKRKCKQRELEKRELYQKLMESLCSKF